MSKGGVFAIGALIDLGHVRSVGSAPEVEDQLFDESNLRFKKMLKADEFWKTVKASSAPTLWAIFGPDLGEHVRGCAVSLHSGSASLGCLSKGAIDLDVDRWNKVKLQINGGDFNPYLSVTDFRIYKADQSPRQAVVSRLIRQLSKDRVLICVGLARSWTKPGDTEARHWLQVNNLHFESDPLGEVLF